MDIDCHKANANIEGHLEKWQQMLSEYNSIEIQTAKRKNVETAKMRIQEPQEKQIYYYDLKLCKSVVFGAGSQVLMKDLSEKKQKGGKLDTGG